jgi:hypothetical protein
METINSFLSTDCSQNKFLKHDIKPTKRKFHKKSPTDTGLVISYDNFLKNKIQLMAFKLAELKDAAKLFKLHITGTKPVLIQRLESHFEKVKFTIHIQRHFRGWMVRSCLRDRGPAVKNRSLCVNDSDFVTMDPLVEIPFFHFFSYKDTNDFIYGFHIFSFMQLIQSSGQKITNPYNREDVPVSVVIDVMRIYRATNLVFPEFRDAEFSKMVAQQQSPPTNRSSLRNSQPEIDRSLPVGPQHGTYQPRVNAMSIVDEESLRRLHRIRETRTRSMEQRIRDLFAEIDQLGNYTQSTWFTNLSHHDYVRLYRTLHEIWNYRGQIPRSIRNKICPFHSPFEGIFNRPVFPSELDYLHLQWACLIVFENMVYSGIDEDHRKLGAFHALSGLTLVSAAARMAMPWLYESVV